LLTDKQTDRQTNNHDYVSSLAEATRITTGKKATIHNFQQRKKRSVAVN